MGRPKKAYVSPPVHRAVLEPIEAKDEDIHIFNVRFGTITIKKGKPSPETKAENARNIK